MILCQVVFKVLNQRISIHISASFTFRIRLYDNRADVPFRHWKLFFQRHYRSHNPILYRHNSLFYPPFRRENNISSNPPHRHGWFGIPLSRMASDGVLVGGAASGVGGAGVGVTGAPPIVRIGSWLFTESLGVVDSPLRTCIRTRWMFLNIKSLKVVVGCWPFSIRK